MIDLRPELLALVVEILAREVPDVRAYAYGSRVTGRARPYSDLDLALEGPSRLAPGRLSTLRSAFEDSDLPIKIDVCDWHALSPAFQEAIAGERRLLRDAEPPSTPHR